MSTLGNRSREGAQSAPAGQTLWWVSLAGIATLLGLGALLRLAGFPVPAWALVTAGALMAFVYILPAIGGRMQEPKDSPFKKAPWGF